MRKHGLRYTVEYSLWLNIKQRCTNPKCDCYPYYGGRGITLCDEWLNSPVQFVEDMGKRPSDAHQIDRINNDLGYSKDNCRWVLKQPQMQNTRLAKRWYVYGVMYPSLSVAAKEYKTTPTIIKNWCEGRSNGKYSYPPKQNCWSEKAYES